MTPVTCFCHICGLTHTLGPTAPETECTVALRAALRLAQDEAARLREAITTRGGKVLDTAQGPSGHENNAPMDAASTAARSIEDAR